MTTINTDLKTLWENTLGEAPTKEQSAIWGELYSQEIIRRAILKTAMKNQNLNGMMTVEHRLRFASRVMLTLAAQRDEHTANREKLRQEFEGQVQR